MSEILKKLAAINRGLHAIEKTKKEGMKFATRGIDEYYSVFSPLIKEHGVIISAKVIKTDYSTIQQWSRDANKFIDTIKIDSVFEFTFHAEDDSTFTTQASGTGMGNDDKGHGKAQSYALKYAFNAMFCIPTKEAAEHEVDYQQTDYSPAKKPAYIPVQQDTELHNFKECARRVYKLLTSDIDKKTLIDWQNNISNKWENGLLSEADQSKAREQIETREQQLIEKARQKAADKEPDWVQNG